MNSSKNPIEQQKGSTRNIGSLGSQFKDRKIYKRKTRRIEQNNGQ